MVLDLHIAHERWGSSSDPSVNGVHLITRMMFMSDIPSTSGRLHSEFVLLLFLQTHRETDRFFTASGVQLPEPTSGLFHFRRAVFSSHLKPRVVNILGNLSTINLVSIFRCSSSPHNPVYVRRVDPSPFAFSLSSHRYSYIRLLFTFHFIS